jgi:hypothetical protein
MQPKSNLLLAAEWMWSHRGENLYWRPNVLTDSNPDPDAPKITMVEAESIFRYLEDKGLLHQGHNNGHPAFFLEEAKTQEWESFLSEQRAHLLPKKVSRSVKTHSKKFSLWKNVVLPLLGTGGIGVIIVAIINSRGGKTTSSTNITSNTGPVIATWGNSNTINNTTVNYSPLTNRISPRLPIIKVETFAGLPVEMTNNPNLRLTSLVVRNLDEVPIENFCSRLQLAEPIIETIETNHSVGTLIGWRALKVKMLVNGTAGRTEGGLWIGSGSTNSFEYPVECFFPSEHRGQKIEYSGDGKITGIWELTIDKLPPGGYVSLTFLTSKSSDATNYIRFANEPLWKQPPESPPDTNELRFFLEGQYSFRTEASFGKQHFLMPMIWDEKQRMCSSLEVQSNVVPWHPVMLNLY